MQNSKRKIVWIQTIEAIGCVAICGFVCLAQGAEPTADAAAKILWETFERKYQITDSSIGMYRVTLTPDERKDPVNMAKWADPNFKAQVRLALEKKIIQQIKSEFSEAEIKYLNEIQKYRLMIRYETFQHKLLEPYGLEVVREAMKRPSFISDQSK